MCICVCINLLERLELEECRTEPACNALCLQCSVARVVESVLDAPPRVHPVAVSVDMVRLQPDYPGGSSEWSTRTTNGVEGVPSQSSVGVASPPGIRTHTVEVIALTIRTKREVQFCHDLLITSFGDAREIVIRQRIKS